MFWLPRAGVPSRAAAVVASRATASPKVARKMPQVSSPKTVKSVTVPAVVKSVKPPTVESAPSLPNPSENDVKVPEIILEAQNDPPTSTEVGDSVAAPSLEVPNVAAPLESEPDASETFGFGDEQVDQSQNATSGALDAEEVVTLESETSDSRPPLSIIDTNREPEVFPTASSFEELQAPLKFELVERPPENELSSVSFAEVSPAPVVSKSHNPFGDDSDEDDSLTDPSNPFAFNVDVSDLGDTSDAESSRASYSAVAIRKPIQVNPVSGFENTSFMADADDSISEEADAHAALRAFSTILTTSNVELSSAPEQSSSNDFVSAHNSETPAWVADFSNDPFSSATFDPPSTLVESSSTKQADTVTPFTTGTLFRMSLKPHTDAAQSATLPNPIPMQTQFNPFADELEEDSTSRPFEATQPAQSDWVADFSSLPQPAPFDPFALNVAHSATPSTKVCYMHFLETSLVHI
jgi:hypothetical protein